MSKPRPMMTREAQAEERALIRNSEEGTMEVHTVKMQTIMYMDWMIAQAVPTTDLESLCVMAKREELGRK